MKVLIVSHNPINTYQNMGKTFLSLFSEFKEEELCQFYIYPSYPDVKACHSYYRVTDKEVVKSILSFKAPGGEVAEDKISQQQKAFENPKDERLYRSRKNKSSLRRLMRDFIWKVARWDNKKLEQWIEEEKPEVIFVAPGVAKFLYDIALWISKKWDIPMIVYICDEYYFVNPRKKLIDRIQLSSLRRKMEKLMRCSSHIVTISEEMKELYSKQFEKPVTAIMSGSRYTGHKEYEQKKQPESVSYFGNIRCNRFMSLKEIGVTLDLINEELGSDYKLKIYTAEKDEEILATFHGVKSIDFCGFVTGEQFEEELLGSDYLLHTEAFDEQSIDFVKHSISTKIADCLACGVPMIAYGPENISSIRHLMRNNCALVATTKDELKEILKKSFLESDANEDYVKNALETASRYHSQEVNSAALYKILKDYSK